MINNPEGKLRTYALFKTELGCEKYLHEITNITVRQSLTKFRLSNSILNIEKGRHTHPKTPKEERVCPFCTNKVEDEVHFLLECPVYRTPREEMISAVTQDNPSFSLMTPKAQFVELMSPENSQFVAKTIDNFFEIRNFLINKPKRPIWILPDQFLYYCQSFYFNYYCYFFLCKSWSKPLKGGAILQRKLKI